MRGPGDPRNLGDDRGLIYQFSGEHQIGASLGLDGGEQFAIALANCGKQDLAQGTLGSLANIHQHGHELVVFRLRIGPTAANSRPSELILERKGSGTARTGVWPRCRNSSARAISGWMSPSVPKLVRTMRMRCFCSLNGDRERFAKGHLRVAPKTGSARWSKKCSRKRGSGAQARIAGVLCRCLQARLRMPRGLLTAKLFAASGADVGVVLP